VHLDRSEGDVLEHVHVREKVETLKHHAHAAPDGDGVHPRIGHHDPVERDRSGIDGLQQVDAAQQGGLSTTAGTDETQHLVLAQVEVDALQHRTAAKRFMHALDL
jgi:hypothetical protein